MNFPISNTVEISIPDIQFTKSSKLQITILINDYTISYFNNDPNSGPFNYRKRFVLSNIGLAWYSDFHCMAVKVSTTVLLFPTKLVFTNTDLITL